MSAMTYRSCTLDLWLDSLHAPGCSPLPAAVGAAGVAGGGDGLGLLIEHEVLRMLSSWVRMLSGLQDGCLGRDFNSLLHSVMPASPHTGRYG